MDAAASFLRTLPRLLAAAPTARPHGRGGRHRSKPTRRLSAKQSLSDRALARLLERLDVDHEGRSLRTGRWAWPESWDLALEICQHLGSEYWMALVLASWLEGLAVSSRRTYAYLAREFLRELRAQAVAEIGRMPEQAALTWQRDQARRLLPRSVNAATATLNSLMGHAVRLGLRESWAPVPTLKITRGRHIDREAVVLDADQLLRYWQVASTRPQRQFLALLLASLHGLRASEVAGLTWGSVRYARRGKQRAPAVLHVIGKGRKHRAVQVHPALRGWLERARMGQPPTAFVLADLEGRPPSAQTVSWWAKDVFRRAGVQGYAHALRATWTTLALEHRGNNALQVQQSGGWRDQATMLGHYYKRRRIPAIRLVQQHGRY